MLGEEHFKLRLVRLQPSELWANQSRNEDEFTFVFIKGGIAKYVFPNATQRLVPGTSWFSTNIRLANYTPTKKVSAFLQRSLCC